MATFSKQKLSGSTNGRPILVVATATAGTLIHTVGTGIDEVWLYASNTSVVAVKLTIELGGVTAPNDLIELGVPEESGLVFVIPGIPIDGSVVIRAFAATASVINVVGWANRIGA